MLPLLTSSSWTDSYYSKKVTYVLCKRLVPSMYFTLNALSILPQEQNEMNLIALVTTVAIVLSSFALSSCRARRQAQTKANTQLTDIVKRLEATEATNAICVANLNALMLNLAAFHKARVVRNDIKRRYNDSRRDTELISATHRAEMNYKKAKDNLSSYVIEATEA